MHSESNLTSRTDDHALEAVPDNERQNWLQLSWSTAGIVTTLIQLFVGALVTFVAGIRIGLFAGVFVAVAGALLGWGAGHIAYRTGLSSTVLSRQHGLGPRGSALLALVFGFMITGFIALENALLYKGFLFYLDRPDTLEMRIVVYGALSVAWILLTAFGFRLVARVSSLALLAFVAVLVYMMVEVITGSGQSWASVTQFGAQMPMDALRALGADTDAGKFSFCVNVMIGSAGALALIDADLGRYAKSSRDIAIAAVIGNLFMDVVMVAVGGIVMYAGMDQIVAHHMKAGGMTEAAARTLALQSPDSVAVAFIVFGGLLGTLLMVFAQSKAQVLNTYSASLSLTNLADVLFDWRPGRLTFVVLANVLACLMLVGSILTWFNSFITVLGVLTTGFAGIIIADYLLVSRISGFSAPAAEEINWAGVVTVAAGFVLAHYVLERVVPIEFFTSLITSFVLYPVLRVGMLKRMKLVRGQIEG
ncbi:purine-cytosine permease-like transporter [Burkholderia sp. IDO3]|uniref:purine-cytosine permease family protein n=1 Tax=Burkholderia sp. IDO3 TaxID=1705310 RepID=UPI000BBA6960|nr:purine-cytosine permease-like transporter [Burkholderia sp. IDO3]AXK67851.1 purine-cytosine permease-like transporter [Burkholderia sp. IDO3]PCD60784.1 purine-cytosine permease-like transporter [Burkholderia sp. IDO3]